MEIVVGGERIPYSYKNQVDKNNVQRRYCRAVVIVSTNLETGKHIKREITAPTEERLKAKICAIQTIRSLNEGSLLAFEQYIKNWLKRNQYRLKPTTYQMYEYNLEHYILPLLGSVKMADLNEAVFFDFFNTLIDEHPVSVAHRAKSLLSIPMKEACEKGLTCGNPLSYVKLPKQQRKAIIPLSKTEASRLICLCRENPYGGPIALSLLLALRISEDIGLSLDSIDIEHRLIHIRRQINKLNTSYVVQNTTKNCEERVLYLDDLCMEFINRELERQKHQRILAGEKWNNEYNCLFTDPTGNFIKHSTLRAKFKILATQIGRPDLKFHHLRHTAATIVNEELHDINAAKELLGHKHYDSTGIYVHSSAEKMKAAVMAISNYVSPKDCTS